MRAIDYQAPTSLSEAVSIMAANGDRARPLAGGTDVLVQLRGGRREADVVVDTKKIPEAEHAQSERQRVAARRCGCVLPDLPGLRRCRRLSRPDRRRRHDRQHPDPGPRHRRREPVQRRAFGRHHPAGNHAGRRGAHQRAERLADPAGGELLHRPGPQRAGKRRIAGCHPVARAGRQFRHRLPAVHPRNEMDIAVAGVSSSVQLDASGQTIQSARIALASVGPTPILATAAGDSLAGKAVSDEAIAEAGRLASEAATPITDMRGTIRQRHHLVDVLTRRTLNIAIRRARGEE